MLGALAGAVFASWAALRLGAAPGVAAGLGAASALAAGAAAWLQARPRPMELRWNGEQWSADGASGALEVMLDLGAWLLLRITPESGRPRWLPLALAEAGPVAHALRAALYSPAVATGDSGA